MTTRTRSGFTLIEILIVVIVLGIMTSIVVPQLTSGTRDSREATLKDCLRYLRTQIHVYQTQHNDVPPGYPGNDPAQTADATTFVAQMTQYSDPDGNISGTQSKAFAFGPYISEMPANPLSAKNGILLVTGPTLPAPDPSQPYGWMYCPQTKQIVANLAGTDEEGVPYSTY